MSQSNFDARRKFLLRMSAGMAGTAVLGLCPQLDVASRAMAATIRPDSGYKAIVSIFLFGGNDSFNLLIPYPAATYAEYHAMRGGVYSGTNARGLAYARDSLKVVRDVNGLRWGINPEAGDFLPGLFNAGELAFVANVGPLARGGLNNQNYGTQPLPAYLYSHNDQQRLWMRGHSQARSLAYGWGGLTADLLDNRDAVALKELSPSISIAGNNLFQLGQFTSPYNMGINGPVGLRRASSAGSNPSDIRRRALMDMLGPARYEPVMKSYYGNLGQSSILLQEKLEGEFAANGEDADIKAFFLRDGRPEMSRLGAQLCMVARSIRASRRPSVNHHRQIYFAGMGGFDTHDRQMAVHGQLLHVVAEAMKDFRDALAYIGALNDTVTFTMSDFGRTLNSNGNGTDHGWGGVQMVMSGSNANGGPLRGRQVWGDYPVFSTAAGTQVIERGRVIPSTSNDQMAATMVRWMGIDNTDLDLIFPDLSKNFDAPVLGFLG